MVKPLQNLKHSILTARNLVYLTLASSRYSILLCSEILVSDRSHVSEFIDLIALSCCTGVASLGLEECLHTCKINIRHVANINFNVVVVKLCFLGYVVRDRTFMCLVFTATQQ